MLVIYYDFLYFSLTMIIIFYIILAARANYEKDFKNVKTINLHYDEIQTGDLLFVYYDTNYHIHSLMSAIFGHVCICSREDSNLYVYEYHNYFQKILTIGLTDVYHFYIKKIDYIQQTLLYYNL